MEQLLHTPEGVRDIYKEECVKKITLQEQLRKTMHLYGYQDIQTPMFEFFDVFSKEIGTIPSKELYKFFDRDGNTLVLRPDITPQIARVAATLLTDKEFPARFCYAGSTFVNHSSYQGRLRENTQMGAELLGLDSAEADAEMLALVIDSLKKVGLEEFQITISNVDFFQSLMEDASVDVETEMYIHELIKNRNYFGVEELLEQKDVKPGTRKAFSMLSELIGDVEILTTAKRLAPNSVAINAIRRLEEIHKVLSYYKMDQYITFDLSMSEMYGYYTGIVFRGYTYGTGDAIVKGGRYDQLVEKFGKSVPAIGFAIVVDELMNALQRQKIEIERVCNTTLILYDMNREKDAIRLARDFRNKEKETALLMKEEKRSMDSYVEYGKKMFAGSILYVQSNHQIQVINLVTDEQKIVKSGD